MPNKQEEIFRPVASRLAQTSPRRLSRLFETGRNIRRVITVLGRRSCTSLKRYTCLCQTGDGMHEGNGSQVATADSPAVFSLGYPLRHFGSALGNKLRD